MFFSRKNRQENENANVKSTLATTEVLERPTAKETASVPLDDNELRAYTNVAGQIDFMPGDLLKARLSAFFKEKDIRLFNYKEVDSYLRKKAESQGKKWHWRPLREKDVTNGWGYIGEDGHGYCWNNRWECRSYNRAVPLRVLMTVEEIAKRFGDHVKFFVSDYASPNPDPFIGVGARDINISIFDVWDEPDFK